MDLSMAIALKPGRAQPYYVRALAREEMGAHDQARGDYAWALVLLTTAIAAKPRDGLLYAERGLIYERTGHKDQAITDETHALALHCLHPAYAYVYRGLAYDSKGAHAMAVSDLQSAIRLDRFSRLEWDRMKRADSSKAPR